MPVPEHSSTVHSFLAVGAYLDRSKAGYLSPEIQIRNLKLFGYVSVYLSPSVLATNFLPPYLYNLYVTNKFILFGTTIYL